MRFHHHYARFACAAALATCAAASLKAQFAVPPFVFNLRTTSSISFVQMEQEFGQGGLFEGYRHATAAEVWTYVDFYFDNYPDPNGYLPVQEMLSATGGQLAGVISYGYSQGFVAEQGIFLFGVARTTEPWWGSVSYYPPPNPTTTASSEVGHFLVAVPEPAYTATVLLSLCLTLVLIRRRSTAAANP